MVEPLRFPPPPLAGPARRDALGPLAERLTEVPRALCFEAVPFPGQLWVQALAPTEAVSAAVSEVLGVAPPSVAGQVARGEDVEVLCLDDGWLVVTPGGREEVLQRRLRQALDGQVAAVTDLTDARAVFHLAGPLAREVLAKGGALPLDAATRPGHCWRARLGGVDGIVQQTDDRPVSGTATRQPCFRLYVPVSLARGVVSWVLAAVSEH